MGFQLCLNTNPELDPVPEALLLLDILDVSNGFWDQPPFYSSRQNCLVCDLHVFLVLEQLSD